jgi:cytochrome o ubiquinol oxidase operon protein cyoD
MNTQITDTRLQSEDGHGSFRSYTIGFIVSIVLTLAAYLSVVNHLLSGELLLVTIAELAIMQLLVQLIFFLHMGTESKPRWKLAMFISAVSIICILVIGSIWIMNHLNYQMTPPQMNDFLIQDEGIQK